MKKTAPWRLAVAGGACLLVLPSSHVFTAGLRDEAVPYRTEGYARQQQGDLAGAVSAYQKAAAVDPSYPAPQNDLGVVYEQMERFEDATRAYEQALLIDPNYLEAHTNLAILAERLGDRDKAVAHWLKRYQLGEPTDPWTARAEERLKALGVLTAYPSLKGKIYTQRQVLQQEFDAYHQSIETFHSLTEQKTR